METERKQPPQRERDDTVFLSMRTANLLLVRNVLTIEQIRVAIVSGQLADIGPKALAECRRLVGFDPPLAPEVIGAVCPRCGGDSGYRVNVHVAQVREYTWKGALSHTGEEQLKTESQLVCRDCEQRIALTAPHRRPAAG